MKSKLLSLYQARFGTRPEAILDLRADGSNRSLFRLIGPDGSTTVGVWGPDHEENRAFISFSRSFAQVGLPVPQIHAVDEDDGIYIEEDLGDTTLFSALVAARLGDEFPEDILAIYRKVTELLARVQVEGGKAIDYSVAYPCTEFDRRSMMWDLNYFKYHFLKLAKVPFNEARLENDFARFCDFLLRADRTNFLYRDFQSRNIMLRDGAPWLIDYQGGRRGALQYDIASLLYDAKADIPDAVRDILLEHYLDALAGHISLNRDEFRELYPGFVLIRIMQAMGAYGYRGFYEGKAHFLASVPYAVANIERLLELGLPVEMPELRGALEHIASSDLRRGEAVRKIYELSADTERRMVPAGSASAAEPHPAAAARKEGGAKPGGLKVHIRSFSFRRGYPADTTEHGGGFVFDCRSLHNPGRYDDYKALCGRDAAVVEFLEQEEKVAEFWGSIRTLADNAVENYLERGFADLSISFGCTGGQHRSVYFAERLARHLAERFPGLDIVLEHREESHWPTANGRES